MEVNFHSPLGPSSKVLFVGNVTNLTDVLVLILQVDIGPPFRFPD